MAAVQSHPQAYRDTRLDFGEFPFPDLGGGAARFGDRLAGLAWLRKLDGEDRADLEQLARMGRRIQLQPYAGAIGSATTRSGVGIVLAQAVAPYPDPAAFLKTALGGGFGQDGLAKLGGLDRDQRVSAASQLELQLMRGPAPLAAIGTPVIPEFFSARVSCHVFQPLEFGADLGSLCLG
jgi:hypothetical protein